MVEKSFCPICGAPSSEMLCPTCRAHLYGLLDELMALGRTPAATEAVLTEIGRYVAAHGG